MNILIEYMKLADLAELSISYLIPRRVDRVDLGQIIKSGALLLWNDTKKCPTDIFSIAAQAGCVESMKRLFAQGLDVLYYCETIADEAVHGGNPLLLRWIYENTTKRLNRPKDAAQVANGKNMRNEIMSCLGQELQVHLQQPFATPQTTEALLWDFFNPRYTLAENIEYLRVHEPRFMTTQNLRLLTIVMI